MSFAKAQKENAMGAERKLIIHPNYDNDNYSIQNCIYIKIFS